MIIGSCRNGTVLNFRCRKTFRARFPQITIARDETQFARVVAAAFSQRRKTVRNSLRGLIAEPAFAALGISPAARAQELSVAQFIALADHLTGLPEKTD